MKSASTLKREIDHFDALAETWWDPTGPFWPLHTLNQLRIGWILERAREQGFTGPDPERPLDGLRVLDIGCGGGILSESLARAGASVHGIDVVPRNIDIARLHAEKSGLTIGYEARSVEDLVSTGAEYDLVFNMEVVEHVDGFEAFLCASQSLVRPGGLKFIATINRNPLAWLVAVFGAEYVLRWLPRGTHHYALLRKPAEVRHCLGRDGFREVAACGVAVNPFTRRMHVVRSMLVNYMLCARRPENPA